MSNPTASASKRWCVILHTEMYSSNEAWRKKLPHPSECLLPPRYSLDHGGFVFLSVCSPWWRINRISQQCDKTRVARVNERDERQEISWWCEMQSNHPINHCWSWSDRGRGGGLKRGHITAGRVLCLHSPATCICQRRGGLTWMSSVYQILVSLEVPRTVKELLAPNYSTYPLMRRRRWRRWGTRQVLII